MNTVSQASQSNIDTAAFHETEYTHAVSDKNPLVLTEIYRDDINMAIWQRQLSDELKQSVSNFLKANPTFKSSMTVTPENALTGVSNLLGTTDHPELTNNIAELVDMYCCLFELKRVGLRLTVLEGAMCPNFHADKVPCRLLTTFQGIATEWLPHELVNRNALRAGGDATSPFQSGLYQSANDIQQLNCGDVALLKGELWEGNENAGLVHRSPTVTLGERRLLLTLDFSN